ncbi:AsmA family protein [Nitratidesulfovibrio sp. HK-II]|uniref:AsmA family protein n=1 Tax=Nitratidesulfovibrio sp. HK-II TaxID=2009266 RepID=UPI000E2F3CC1|nr:AsmA family protein [Nitratidesulfovibrio sp. HK-II]GBO96731.1 AsmA family protein [Nitratidesulfovibrio sp. HK-II]
MNKTLKLVAAAIGALVIVAAAAVAIVVATIDPNDYKGRIADAARSATGRELVFDGDLSLSFFPWLGIAFGPMHLGNPPDFPKAASPDDDVFLRLKGGGLRVAFMPLLSKRVEVAELILDGLHLNLVRTAEGKTNWDFAKPGAAPAPSAQASAPSAPSGKDAGGSGGGSPLAVAVDTLSVNGATLSFRDMATGQQFRARDLNVAVNGLAPGGDPADIRMNVAMSGQKPDIEADLSVTAKVQSDLGGSVLEVKGLTVTLTPKGGVLPAGLGKVELAGDMTLHTGPQRLDIASLSLSTPTLRLGGKGAAALAAPSFEGVLTLAGSPRKALEALGNPVRTADPKALDALDLKLDVQAAPAKVDVRSITGKLDDTAIQGKASAVPGQVQVIRAELALDAIDVDRYLPPEGEKGKAADKGAAPAAKDGKAAPQGGTAEAKKALRNFDVDVTFKAGRLVASKVPMTNVLVRLVADKGLVRVNPLKLNLGGGSVDGDITADTRAEATKSRIVSTVKGVEVGELQQAALGKRHVSARTDVKTDLSATGDDWNAAKHSLAGTASLAMTQGTIHGFQIIPEGIKGAESKRAGASGQKFDSLTASIRADKGVVSNKDLKFVSPGIGATGAGTADLGRNVVDYAATLDVTGLPKIPIKISGSLDSPSYGVDPAKMLMNTLEGAGNVIQAPAEKGGEAVKGIGGAIKGLLPGQKQ